jgi:hypothetical protein
MIRAIAVLNRSAALYRRARLAGRSAHHPETQGHLLVSP